jgi:adenylate cyclase class IV
MQFREIETKYDASAITLKDFTNLIKSKFNIKKHLLVSSFDDYFTDKDDNFLRYRHKEDRGELTIKRKLDVNNNNKRVEVNLPMDGDSMQAVTQFAELLGYKHNFCVYKTCDVYWVDNMVICYYVVYNEEWKEQRRFIEIEANEDFQWESEEFAWQTVESYEKHFAALGVSSKNRLKKSLFEMFKQS